MFGSAQAEASSAVSQKCEKKDDMIREMQQQLSTAALEMHNLHSLNDQEQQNLRKDLQALQEHAHSQHTKVDCKNSHGYGVH